jgi:hypothetical protein
VRHETVGVLTVVFIAFVGLSRLADAQELDIHVTVPGHPGQVAGASSDNFLTFSGPVGVPRVGLAPGAYVFRFIAPSVMQVLNESRSIVLATFFVTPAWRSDATEYTVTLQRVRNDAPVRIAALFPRDASTGYEFIYPKTESAGALLPVSVK